MFCFNRMTEGSPFNYYCMDAASLLPVLMLDLKPGDSMLDMCAGKWYYSKNVHFLYEQNTMYKPLYSVYFLVHAWMDDCLNVVYTHPKTWIMYASLNIKGTIVILWVLAMKRDKIIFRSSHLVCRSRKFILSGSTN